MAAQTKPKTTKGIRNSDRRCGKAWKGGLPPAKRDEAARQAAAAKRARKAPQPVTQPEGG